MEAEKFVKLLLKAKMGNLSYLVVENLCPEITWMSGNHVKKISQLFLAACDMLTA